MIILVVEDNEEMRTMLCDVLREKGHTVYPAENGKKAIDLLSVYSLGLIITDIVMPEIEGIELILRLRQSNIPVISISGLSRETVVSGIMASLGIVGFIQKPFLTGELMQIVDNVTAGAASRNVR